VIHYTVIVLFTYVAVFYSFFAPICFKYDVGNCGQGCQGKFDIEFDDRFRKRCSYDEQRRRTVR